MKTTSRIRGVIVTLALVFAPVLLPAAEENPYMLPDETWISISGTAVETTAEAFILDYGEGLVTVEMGELDWYQKDFRVIEGDKVTVYGEIDDDFYDTTTIEADSVYDEDLNQYFYNFAEENEYQRGYDYWVDGGDIQPGRATVRGTVRSIQGRELTIDTGPRMLTVDTITIPYNPLDDKGYTKVEKGDYVSVTGSMGEDFWDERELKADAIVVLSGE